MELLTRGKTAKPALKMPDAQKDHIALMEIVLNASKTAIVNQERVLQENSYAIQISEIH